MIWFDLIGIACLVAGLSAVNFLTSLRAVAKGKLPGWHFTVIAIVAVSYIAAGTGLIAQEVWRFYPLVVALLGTGIAWHIGSKNLWDDAKCRDH